VYTDWREALTTEQPEVVSVCVPACLHAEVSIAALEAGAYVMCEKPIALTLADADRMVAASEAAGNRLRIIFQRRWTPAWQFARERLEAIGSPVVYRASDFRRVRPKLAMHDARQNGGPVVDCAVHDFDMTLDWFGPATSVYATGSIFAQGKPEVASVAELAVDTATITVTFAQGNVANIAYGWGMPATFTDRVTNEVAGPDGLIEIVGDRAIHHHTDGQKEGYLHAEQDGHVRQIAAFIDAIREGTPLPGDPRRAREASALSHAALESIRTGELIRFD
jgi:myo-inositol 2-dehydrogenase/D-chiro-inositol 1-dehydrogenase